MAETEVDTLRAALERLRSIIRREAELCSLCNGTGREPLMQYDAASDEMEPCGTTDCHRCRHFRGGAEGDEAMSKTMPFGQLELVGAILGAIDRLGLKTLNARQMNAVIRAADDIMAELRKPHREAVAGSGSVAWLQSDATGMSSLYMLSVLAPLAGIKAHVRRPDPSDPHPYPHDPSDFDRCIGLLDAEPGLRSHLTALASGHGAVWPALIGAWPELETLHREERPTGKAPKLFARMRELIEAARQMEVNP